MLMNKFTTSFLGEKSAQDTGSFENGNSVETKKGVHDFMRTTSLMCKKQYINITEELNSKQRNQNSDINFISLKIFPRPAKMLQMSQNVNFS